MTKESQRNPWICTQLYSFNYSYLIQTILTLYYYLFTQLYGIKYSHIIWIIWIHSYLVSGFLSKADNLHQVHFCRRIRLHKVANNCLWMVKCNVWGCDLGSWAVLDLATEEVRWLVKLHFGSYWARQAVREARFDQSVGHVKSWYLYDCLNRILQIALVTSKCSTLSYLEGARRQQLRVTCAEITILETI